MIRLDDTVVFVRYRRSLAIADDAPENLSPEAVEAVAAIRIDVDVHNTPLEGSCGGSYNVQWLVKYGRKRSLAHPPLAVDDGVPAALDYYVSQALNYFLPACEKLYFVDRRAWRERLKDI